MLRILVVGHDPALRRSAVGHLNAMGHDAIGIGLTDVAESMLRKTPFDLIVLQDELQLEASGVPTIELIGDWKEMRRRVVEATFQGLDI